MELCSTPVQHIPDRIHCCLWTRCVFSSVLDLLSLRMFVLYCYVHCFMSSLVFLPYLLALIARLFTENLFLWLGVGVETHFVPSAASGYLGVYSHAAFVPLMSMSSKRSSSIIKHRKQHIFSRTVCFSSSDRSVKESNLKYKQKYAYEIKNVLHEHTYTHLFYIFLIDPHCDLVRNWSCKSATLRCAFISWQKWQWFFPAINLW